jgi:carboxyl-terminal processing protease
MGKYIKRSIFLGGITAVVVAAFVFGVFTGYNQRPPSQKIDSILDKKTPLMLSELDFEPFWKTWNIIESEYVSNNKIQRQEMLWGALEGLVASLDDPYSVFFPPKDAEIFESSVRGDFEGVGMEIGIRDKLLTVIAPLKDTPADKAGIKAGDKILSINGTSTIDLAIDEAVLMIRGQRGSEVTLTVLREGVDDPFDIGIVRDVIEIPVLGTEVKEDGIFVIELYNFSARSAIEFQNALREMIQSGSHRLIIDLRGNTGGYLESAVDITSWFLPLGEPVALEKFGTGEEEVYRSKGYNIFNNLPLVILINRGTASAAEIMAGALQEYGLATLVGEKSFGKGSVQQLFDITEKSSMKITVAQWLTPNGRSLSEQGLDPDVEVKLTAEDKTDKQMERAIELVKEK